MILAELRGSDPAAADERLWGPDDRNLRSWDEVGVAAGLVVIASLLVVGVVVDHRRADTAGRRSVPFRPAGTDDRDGDAGHPASHTRLEAQHAEEAGSRG